VTRARLELALLGAGAMGANHARVIAGCQRAGLGVVIDTDADRARRLADRCGAAAAGWVEAAFDCDAAVVATPSQTHMPLALALLDAGLPLLIEKPLALDVAGAERVLAASAARGLPLACGFVERFNPVVRTARELLDTGPVHTVTLRHSPVDGRATVGVVHDLLIHDIDLVLGFAGGTPAERVQALCWIPPGGAFAEVADASIRFADGSLATLSASRMGQRKVRSVSLVTTAKALELDLLRQDLTVYRHVRHGQLPDDPAGYRADTVIDIPFVRHGAEPLALQLEHFLDLVEGRADAVEERRGLLAPHRLAAEAAGG
jgi:predicted dehydrogenase